MKRKRKGQSRLLSLTLCLCLLAGIFPMTGITYAAETSCPNHQTHDAECGYVEAVEGAPCNHTCAVCCSEGGMNMDCPVYGAEGASSPTNGEWIIGDGYSFSPDDDKLIVTSNAGTTNWRTDTNIAADETARYNAIWSVEIKRGVTEIEGRAFDSCENLTTVDLPASLSAIGESAFSACTSLTKVDFPSSLATIGEGAFSSCSDLTKLTFRADDPPTISGNVFFNIASTGTIYFPSGKGAAYSEDWKNNNLKLIGWTRMEQANPILTVFYNDNGSGEDDEMEDAIEKALSAPGVDQEQITTIRLQGSATEITDYNWLYLIKRFKDRYWVNLTTLDLSGLSDLEKVENETKSFSSGFSKFQSVILPNSLKTIGKNAFYACSGLTTLELPTGLTTIGKSAFAGCSGLTTLKLPAGLTTIGSGAFTSCSGLTTLDLPVGLTTIGALAFSGCTRLTAINASAENAAFISENGILYNKEKTTLLQYPMGKTDTTFSVPQGITDIGDYAFYCCTGLTLVGLPASLTAIGKDAFSGCVNLQTLAFRSEKAPALARMPLVIVSCFKITYRQPARCTIPRARPRHMPAEPLASPNWKAGRGQLFTPSLRARAAAA